MTETPADTPRRGRETDPVRALARRLRGFETQLAALSKAANLRNASITGGEGLTVRGSSVTVLDADGLEAARYGLLVHTDPGEYGLEVLHAGAWVRVGIAGTTLEALAAELATLQDKVAALEDAKTAQDTLNIDLIARLTALEGTTP